MAEDSIGGVAHAVAGVVRHLFYFDSFCVVLGLFLFIYGIFNGNQPAMIIGIRAILFAFGGKWIHGATWKYLEWYAGFIMVAVALMPSHYFLAAYAYLK